jgi:hypothetical protein
MTLVNPYRDVIEKAKRDLAEVSKRIEELKTLRKRKIALESLIANATRLLEDAEQTGQQQEPPDLPMLAYGLAAPIVAVRTHTPLWKHIQSALENESAPLSAKEVLDILVRKNVQVNGTHKIETVRASMSCRPDIFERTTRGMFSARPVGESRRLSGLIENSAAQETTH